VAPEGGKQMRFAKRGEPSGPYGMEKVICGIDVYEMTKNLAEDLLKQVKGEPSSLLDIDEMGRRSVQERPL
jgi:hypothetical protein